MKLFSIFYLALFPFLHNTVYSVQVESCSADNITLHYQGASVPVSLFNLKITREEGWGRVCTLLKEANQVTFEVDTNAKIEEPIPVYLFADGVLIQEEVIKNKEGYNMIRNPEYKYAKKLMEMEDSVPVMANAHSPETTDRHFSYGWLFLVAFICIWSFLFYHLIYKYKRKRRLK